MDSIGATKVLALAASLHVNVFAVCSEIVPEENSSEINMDTFSVVRGDLCQETATLNDALAADMAQQLPSPGIALEKTHIDLSDVEFVEAPVADYFTSYIESGEASISMHNTRTEGYLHF